MADLTRRDQTILLLQSRHDWHPTVRSQFAGFGAVPGEKATVWVLCRSCNGDGSVNGRKGPEPCQNCNSQGRFQVDAYTEKRSAEETVGQPMTGHEREEWRRKTDQRIAQLNAQLERPPEVRTAADLADVEPYPWERDRDRHMKAGSYRELDQALEWLTVQSPPGRALVGWVYESGALELGCLHPTVLNAAQTAVDVLAQRLPDPIRVPRWLLPVTDKQAEQIQRRTANSKRAA